MIAQDVFDDYLQAVLGSDVDAARRVVDAALEAGLPPRDVYLHVLQPALYEVGDRWARAEISIAQEHLVTAVTQSLMTRLAERLGSGHRRGSALVACAEDELHAVGARMVADFLQAEGWDVLFLGALVPAGELAELAAERGVDVVALSAALPGRIPHVTAACAALRALDPRPFIIIGGQAFGGSAERALAAGADGYAPDAGAAVALLEQRVA